MKEQMITEGIAAFINLDQCDVYNGKDTGWFNITLNMEDAEAAKLEQAGVKVKVYKDQPQRQFKSKYPIKVVDEDGTEINKDFPFGSKVRVLWETGQPHPTYGVGTYLKAVKVLEMADGGEVENEDF